ncbi:hypothetical protein BH10ACT1_BH10ACT1_27760 [soil metagenome]
MVAPEPADAADDARSRSAGEDSGAAAAHETATAGAAAATATATADEAAAAGRRLQAELPPGSNRIPPRDRDQIGDWLPNLDARLGIIALVGAAVIAVGRWLARSIERAMKPKGPKSG